MNEELEQIAKSVLGIDTLETRNSDSLDFHEVSVWGLKNALKKAYELGQKNKDKVEEIEKRDLTVEDVQRIVMCLSDDIYDAYGDDDGNVHALNFYVHAYDYSYIWAKIYKDYDELEKALENDCGACTTYIYFFPETKKLILAMEDVHYNWFEFEINDGEGKDLLIKLCEMYSQESEGKTCLELLNEMNSY